MFRRIPPFIVRIPAERSEQIGSGIGGFGIGGTGEESVHSGDAVGEFDLEAVFIVLDAGDMEQIELTERIIGELIHAGEFRRIIDGAESESGEPCNDEAADGDRRCSGECCEIPS